MNRADLQDRLGLELLSFCLATPRDEVARWVTGTAELGSRAEASAARCTELADEVPPGMNAICSAFCEGKRDGPTSAAVEMHLAAGGTLPDPPEGDAVASALAPLAAEAFALLLLADPVGREQQAALAQVRAAAQSLNPNVVVEVDPRLPASPFMEGRLMRLVLVSPYRNRVGDALAADPAVIKLFAAGRNDPVPTVIWASSLGHAQTVQLPSLAEMMLGEGYRRVRALARGMVLEQYFLEVLSALATAREAGLSGEVEVPAIIALRGGHLVGSTELSTPWGTIRPFTAGHAELGPPAAGGQVVLETTVTLSVALGSDLDATDPSPDATPPWVILRERARTLGEASILATGGPVVPTWLSVLDPFAISLRPVPEFYAFGPPLADRALTADLAEWSSLLDASKADHGVTLARSRLLNATLRSGADDALIDAVVAWEALFGDRQGELRFRIATSIAWLLGDNRPEREALFQQSKAIYDFRSEIVHGGKTRPQAEIVDNAVRAMEIAADALRALYRRGGAPLIDNQARTRDLFLGP